MEKYPISSEDCVVLLAIRNSQTLRDAARLLDCDPGGLLRKVQRIATDHGLLIKNEGKWRLTDAGLALVGWTQETILSQKKLLLSEAALRIASPSWFSERVLIPRTSFLRDLFGDTTDIQYSIPDQGFEKALTEGDCDFVVACHAPENPIIAHKQITFEKWSVVLAASYAKSFSRNRKKLQLSDLSSFPCVRHHGLNPDALLPFDFSGETKSFLSMDNLIGVRAAILSGFGWGFVPTALVKSELDNGMLIQIEHDAKMDRKVCLWWLRSSTQARKKSPIMSEWVKEACSTI